MAKPRHHYFLIAGLVMFTIEVEGQEDPDIKSIPTNAVVRHDQKNFPAHKLGKAQQNLHKTMMTKMPEEAHAAITLRDIVITNVSYLGQMTEEEFQAVPVYQDVAVPEVV